MEVKKQLIKNINASEIYNLKELVDYREGIIESRTLSQGKNLSITLFAFDKNEEISAHSSPGEAFVYIIDGEAEIIIGDKKFRLKEGQTIIIPTGIPHTLFAVERFKMLLIVVFEN